MAHSCPWCREPLPTRHPKERPCPSCGRDLVDGAGRELRDLDLRFERVEAEQWRRFHTFLFAGAAVAAAVALAVPFTHLGAVLLVPLLVVTHFVLVRLLLVRDAVLLLGRGRRLFNRWLLRLAFLWGGGVGYGLATVPLLGVLPAVGSYLGLTAAAHHYTLWGLRSERDRRPLAGWEKLSLGCLGLVTVVVVVGGGLLVAAVGWSLVQILEWLRSVASG